MAIWSRIIAFDKTVRADLVKDDAVPCFVSHLSWGLNSPTGSSQRVMAAFVLAGVVRGYPQGRAAALQANALQTCVQLLSSAELDAGAPRAVRDAVELRVPER